MSILRRGLPSRQLARRTLVQHRLITPRVAGSGVPNPSFAAEVIGLRIDFTDTSDNPDEAIVAWHWDFGDTEESTEQNPSHTYASDGVYDVTLTVTDYRGQEFVFEDSVETIDVPVDGPGLVYLPGDDADWVELGLPAPSFQWNCQEASGDLQSAIGSLALADANSGHLFEQTVTGWTAKAVGFAAGATGSWSTSDDAMDIAAGESFACLVYGGFEPVTLGRRFLVLASGGTTSISANGNSTTKVVARFSSAATVSPGSYGTATTIIPWLIGRNCTTSVARLFTDREQVNGTFATTATAGAFGIGGFGTAAETCRYVRVAFWKGADAETILAKSTLQTLRWDLSY